MKQHVLLGAAYQLDARLSGMHQGAIRRKIVKRHAARGETCLEPLSDRVAIQLCEAADCGDSADLIIDNETGQAFIDDLIRDLNLWRTAGLPNWASDAY